MISCVDSAQRSAEPSHLANFAWLTILTLAGIGGSLTISCITPFVALAVALAGTVRLVVALRAMSAVWLANQLIGFVFFHFPRTANTVLWGFAIWAAALLATVIAARVIRDLRFLSIFVRLALALALAYAGYQTALFAAALCLGGRETFSLVVVRQLGLINAVWLVALIGLNELMSILTMRLIGRMPRLVKA